MQLRNRDTKGQSERVQTKKRKKPKAIYSTRKEIEASRMRQLKTRSRVAEIDFGLPQAINFGEDGVVDLASSSRIETLIPLNNAGVPSTETLICKGDGENTVSDYLTLLCLCFPKFEA